MTVIANPDRVAFYEAIRPMSLKPLWESLDELVPPRPTSPCAAAFWRYEEIRPHLVRSGELISAAEAVRRVLILENPGLPGHAAITQSLYAGLQLILPGEVAPAHRHTQSALRLVLEGCGAYTSVDGERTAMQPGDFVITPSWAWHDHGCEGDGPVIWLDGLDIPLVRFLDAGFAESSEDGRRTFERPEDRSRAPGGAHLMPLRETPPHVAVCPVFNYPYAGTREALAARMRAGPPDEWDGIKLRYVNPATGGPPIPTLQTCVQLLPAGFRGRPYRQTDGAVFCVVEGRGVALVGERTAPQCFEFGPRDLFVVPSWHTLRLRAEQETVLFSYSDRPVQQAVGLWREERLAG